MKASEIIKADLTRRGINPIPILRKMDLVIKAHKGFVLQKNQSVLFCLYIRDKDVEVHLYTLDSPLTLAHSLSYFIKRIRASHINAIYGNANNPQIIELLKRLGVDIERPDIKIFNWKAVV